MSITTPPSDGPAPAAEPASMTAQQAPGGTPRGVLDRYFGGERDRETLRRL